MLSQMGDVHDSCDPFACMLSQTGDSVKCLMLLTIVYVVAVAAFVCDRVDAFFTFNYHVWRALSVLNTSVCAETPSAQCSGKDGSFNTVTNPRQLVFLTVHHELTIYRMFHDSRA